MPDGEEKSFPATPKRRAEARKRGQVARSAEFGAAATLLAVVAALHLLLPGDAGTSLIRDTQSAFRFNPHDAAFTFETVHQWQLTGPGVGRADPLAGGAAGRWCWRWFPASDRWALR